MFHGRAAAANPDGVRVDKRRASEECLDIVARELRVGYIYFRLDDMLDPESQIRHGYLVFDPIIDAINVLILIAREVQHRFPQRLRRNGACIDADPTHNIALFHYRDFLARLRRLDRRSLAGWACAQNDHVKFVHWFLLEPLLPIGFRLGKDTCRFVSNKYSGSRRQNAQEKCFSAVTAKRLQATLTHV